jgi:hypothetical protein
MSFHAFTEHASYDLKIIPKAVLSLLITIAISFLAVARADDSGIKDAAPHRNTNIVHGNRWTKIPLDRVCGEAPAPAQQKYGRPIVSPPSNSNGPIINLSDFGAVADGYSPSSPDPDRNLAALNAAISKCRERHASRLTVARGVYRIPSGKTILFEGLSNFTFDGRGSTFLFDQINGGPAFKIEKCNQTMFCNFNLDWDWKKDPLASIGRVTKVASDSLSFEMHFESQAPSAPNRWLTMTPLDERSRAPGAGTEFSELAPTKIELLDPKTVRVCTSRPLAPIVGKLYLLRHYADAKDGIAMDSNKHLSLRDVTIYSFPGIGFIVGGVQQNLELLHCRITHPGNEHRPITTTADGFHVTQSQGFIKLDHCDFGYMGDDCINIHDNIHMGLRRVDAHTLVAERISNESCPFGAGDFVELRNPDLSLTGFTSRLVQAKQDWSKKETTLVFEDELPSHISSDAILLNLRYGSHNYSIRDCFFHENRNRGIVSHSAIGLIEGNRFFHNQQAALHLVAEVNETRAKGFGARNVVVRDNRFDDVNPSGAHDGAALYVSVDVGGAPTRYPLLENILIEKNVFTEMTGPAIEAASFKNLVVRNNHFINREAVPLNLPMRGGIRAECGHGLWVEENTWTTENRVASPALWYDAETTKKIICRQNQLKE